VVVAEVESVAPAAAVVVDFEGVFAAAAVDSELGHFACHAMPDPGADCGEVTGAVGGGSAAAVAESSTAANGWASDSCAAVEACSHCDDAMDWDALTSDAELGTA